MAEWWSMQTGIWIGSLGGAGVGVMGGVFGAVAGYLAPRGKCRGLVLGTQAAIAGAGVIALVSGIVAAVIDQPYHVYFPLMLGGGISASVMGGLLPVMRQRYRQAEQRRLDAALMREA